MLCCGDDRDVRATFIVARALCLGRDPSAGALGLFSRKICKIYIPDRLYIVGILGMSLPCVLYVAPVVYIDIRYNTHKKKHGLCVTIDEK